MRSLALLFLIWLALPTFAATSISAIPGNRGVRVLGQVTGDGLGGANMSAIGDVNGDGRADVAIAAPGTSNVGAVYVIFGVDGNLSNPNVSTLNGTNGFKITGSGLPALTQLGGFVTGVGDVNNDDVADILMGSRSGTTGVGKAYIVFGKAAGQSFPAIIDVVSLGSAGVVLNGAASGDYFGFGVASGGGDVNSDGIEDIVLGAERTNNAAGIVYLLFGRTVWPASISIGTEPASSVVKFTGVNPSDSLGGYASIGPDINNDGRPDILVAAFGADATGVSGEQGKLYAIFGRPSGVGFLPTQSVSALDGSIGFEIVGVSVNSGFGYPAVFTGDFNGDGVGDFAAAGLPDNSGFVAVIFGKANWDASISISSLDGNNGTILLGETASAAGSYLAAPGDVNGDGKADLLIGAPGANSNAGKVYLVHGTSTLITSPTNLSAVESALAGEVFTGLAGSAIGPVSGVGKFSNTDLLPDFVIGSESALGDAYIVTKASDVLFRNGFED